MAYAALVSLSQTIDKILHHDQDSIEKQQIISIHGYVTFLQVFLEDFPEKANSLEERIRDVAHKAEDTIEYFVSKEMWSYYVWKSIVGQHEKIESVEQSMQLLQYDFRTLNRELQVVINKIDPIAREVMEIKKGARNEDLQLSDLCVATSSSRLTIASNSGKLDIAMVGFEDDLMAIKGRLCGESSKLQVIPIFGMGGIGKTTLARNAYDDPLTMEYFDIRAWVTVSQDYRAREIISGLLVSMNAESFEKSKESKMAENVYKTLKGRRYLIVMDDMWSGKAWDDVKMILPNDNNGSRIILTTRLSDVATYADSCSPLHEMHFMDADQSWDLLQQRVFKHEQCPLELEDIGKEIARSCRGLPLAIVAIAGLLSTISKTRASWKSIARNVNEIVTTNDEQFAKIVLSLSYNHLPQHLRPCFLYMAGFPEDHEIRVSKLIKLWVAEGFLRPSGSKSFEDTAEEYLEDLVKRSLVLVTRRKSNGKIKSCNVHDLVRDLCIRKSEEEKFIINVMNSMLVLLENQRRVSIYHSDLNCLENVKGSNMHTIICFQRSESSLSFLRNFRLLRILDVLKADVYSLFSPFVLLPTQLFELFQLRYLSIDYPMQIHSETEIPPDISNLQNLQTLVVLPRKKQTTYLPRMILLPLQIWMMPQLRHLISFSFDHIPYPQGATFALENLQTLSEATNFICTWKMLEMIPNLKKLGISYLGDKCDQNYYLENLVYLHQLEKLKLTVYASFLFPQRLNPIFPTTLKKLALSGCQLPWKDMGRVGSLPNLEVLKLRRYACVGDEWETFEGEFPKLKYLLIEESNLRCWVITESSHFPRLKFLLLHRCWHLSEIPDAIGEIPTLELIEVGYSNRCLVDSAKRIQEEQQDSGNGALHVRVVQDYDTWARNME